MSKKVLYIYKWATMGGVERVLINRAQVFKENNINYQQDVFFIFDSGGKSFFEKSIVRLELNGYLNVIDDINLLKYDYIVSIDTPEILERINNKKNVFIECHTAYRENRTYLKNIPTDIKGIITPSFHFKNEIMQEIPMSLRNRIFCLRNCTPQFKVSEEKKISKRFFDGRLISYVGRIDDFKNISETIEIFAKLQSLYHHRFILFIVGPVAKDYDLMTVIRKKGVLGRCIYLPSVPFYKTYYLFELIRANRGVFISSSKGESFGLSAAEAITHQIPVVLSDPHANLIDHDDDFLYPLGDIDKAVTKLEIIFHDYQSAVTKMRRFVDAFSPKHFLCDWEQLFETI